MIEGNMPWPVRFWANLAGIGSILSGQFDHTPKNKRRFDRLMPVIVKQQEKFRFR
jgi:hypothetical protein